MCSCRTLPRPKYCASWLRKIGGHAAGCFVLVNAPLVLHPLIPRPLSSSEGLQLTAHRGWRPKLARLTLALPPANCCHHCVMKGQASQAIPAKNCGEFRGRALQEKLAKSSDLVFGQLRPDDPLLSPGQVQWRSPLRDHPPTWPPRSIIAVLAAGFRDGHPVGVC